MGGTLTPETKEWKGCDQVLNNPTKANHLTTSGLSGCWFVDLGHSDIAGAFLAIWNKVHVDSDS